MTRHTSSTESRSIWCRRRIEACALTTAVVFTTGCLETAGVLVQFESSVRTPLPAQSQPYSDSYWAAVADLDLASSRLVARSDPEIHFAEGFALFAAGNYERAESVFVATSKQRTDLTVAVAAYAMLATTLLYEHKWSALSELSDAARLNFSLGSDILGLGSWGRAFSSLSAKRIDFPGRPVAVPLRITEVGTPAVRLRINGKEREFWLDTGSSLTVLSSDVAHDAGISALNEETLTVGTFGGVAPVKPAVAAKIEIGGLVITNAPAVVMDASLMRIQTGGTPPASKGVAVDGILGWDVIRELDISIDYTSGTITLREPRHLETRGTQHQNLTWVGKPLVEVRSKEGGLLHFTLDTGAQGSFVNSSVLPRLKAISSSSTARAYGIAQTGGNSARVVRNLSVTVGGAAVRLRDLMVYDGSSSSLVNSDGILGSDVAQFGTVRIDATNGLFSVETE